MFLANIPGSSTDGLEGLTPGTLAPFGLSFSGIASTIVTGGNSAVRGLATGTDGFGEFPTSGNNYISSDSNAALTITFSSAVTAFGFYGVDVGDFATARLTVSFTGTSGTVPVTVNDILGTGRGSPADGSVLFFGYINTAAPFTSVQILSPSDSFAFDDPVAGTRALTAAPEPGSLLVSASGLLAVCAAIINKLKKRV